MRPSAHRPISTTQVTSTGTADVKTATAPTSTGGCYITVETNAARVTLDGSAPSSSNGIVIQKDSAPCYMPLKSGTVIKAASTIAANSIVNVAWLS